jgi:CRP-like cAMP-binding protein
MPEQIHGRWKSTMALQNRLSQNWNGATLSPATTRSLPQRRQFRRHEPLLVAGPSPSLTVIKDGWACRSRVTHDGRRQILGIFLPGDVCGLSAEAPKWVEFSVVALSQVIVEVRPVPDVPPAVLLEHALADAAIAARWIARLSQRSAVQKVTDLVDELVTRQGLATDSATTDRSISARFQLTQYDLADATGLTAIHVNRTLRDLRKADVLRLKRGEIEITSMNRLRALAAGMEA